MAKTVHLGTWLLWNNNPMQEVDPLSSVALQPPLEVAETADLENLRQTISRKWKQTELQSLLHTNGNHWLPVICHNHLSRLSPESTKLDFSSPLSASVSGSLPSVGEIVSPMGNTYLLYYSSWLSWHFNRCTENVSIYHSQGKYQLTLRDHRYRANASRGVTVYSPAFARDVVSVLNISVSRHFLEHLVSVLTN